MANIENAGYLGSGFNIGAQSPLDSRLRVQTLDDLTNITSWDKAKFPPYNGMIVSVMESGKVYVLIDESNPYTMNSWRLQTDLDWIEL